MDEKEYYISRMSRLHVDENIKKQLLEKTVKERRRIYGIYKLAEVHSATVAGWSLSTYQTRWK